VLLGVAFLVYVIAVAFTYILSQGEVRRAKRYYKKVWRHGLDEIEGSALGRKLDRTRLCFSVIFFVFAAEEVVRFILHTGPADLLIWVFRFACLAFFMAITSVFLVRLQRWRSFKSTRKYEETMKQIAKLESIPQNAR
jgi:hypothetical protein